MSLRTELWWLAMCGGRFVCFRLRVGPWSTGVNQRACSEQADKVPPGLYVCMSRYAGRCNGPRSRCGNMVALRNTRLEVASKVPVADGPRQGREHETLEKRHHTYHSEAPSARDELELPPDAAADANVGAITI